MSRAFMRFPDFKPKALTVSYDDGVRQDKRLIEILQKYGLKRTFNLNSGLFVENFNGEHGVKDSTGNPCFVRACRHGDRLARV